MSRWGNLVMTVVIAVVVAAAVFWFMGDEMVVQGTTNFDSITLSDDLVVGDDLTVTDATDFGGALDVDGGVTLNGTLDVDGAISAGTGAITLTDAAGVYVSQGGLTVAAGGLTLSDGDVVVADDAEVAMAQGAHPLFPVNGVVGRIVAKIVELDQDVPVLLDKGADDLLAHRVERRFLAPGGGVENRRPVERKPQRAENVELGERAVNQRVELGHSDHNEAGIVLGEDALFDKAAFHIGADNEEAVESQDLFAVGFALERNAVEGVDARAGAPRHHHNIGAYVEIPAAIGGQGGMDRRQLGLSHPAEKPVRSAVEVVFRCEADVEALVAGEPFVDGFDDGEVALDLDEKQDLLPSFHKPFRVVLPFSPPFLRRRDRCGSSSPLPARPTTRPTSTSSPTAASRS